jgi:response regulator RpfG family c-di-GMP phosphodiesterase
MSARAEEGVETRASLGTILFVDDEQNILSSLRRLARRWGYDAIVAASGAEGLTQLGANDVDVVVSDMRMPEMSGAEFLEHVAEHWPRTMRILLTGYADLASAVAAVNRGRIFRYLSKPWEETDLKVALEQAMEIRTLTKERVRLEKLTIAQNEKLKQFNRSLEAKVEQRTAQLRESASLLQQAHADLEDAYVTSVQVFASLLKAAGRRSAEGIRRIVDQAERTARRLGIDEKRCRNIKLAASLCELGKMALPNDLAGACYGRLSGNDAKCFEQHPAIAEQLLLPLGPLEAVAQIIRSHCEHFDGKGYPDGLVGEAIPLESRVLSVVKDFDALTLGLLVPEELAAAEALAFLKRGAGTRYDASVVQAFESELAESDADSAEFDVRRLVPEKLRPGMRMNKDLFNQQGVLMLPKGLVLTNSIIEKLRRMKSNAEESIVLYVQRGAEDASFSRNSEC